MTQITSIVGACCTGGCECHSVRFRAYYYEDGQLMRELAASIGLTQNCRSTSYETIITPEWREFAADSNGLISFVAQAYGVVTTGLTELVVVGWRVWYSDPQTHEETDPQFYRGSRLEFATEETWPGILHIDALYAWSVPTHNYPSCYLQRYALPEYIKLTVPDTLNLDQFATNPKPNGEGCNCYLSGDAVYHDIFNPVICSGLAPSTSCLLGPDFGTLEHINPPGWLILKCAGRHGDDFHYTFQQGTHSCLTLTIRVEWVNIGRRGYFPNCPDMGVPFDWVDNPTGKWNSNDDHPSPWLVAVAEARLKFHLVLPPYDANPNKIRISTWTVYRRQILSDVIPYDTLLAAYRALSELQPTACESTTSTLWPCVSQSGQSFGTLNVGAEDDKKLRVKPLFNPLFKFPSLAGDLVGGVQPFGTFDGFYLKGGFFSSNAKSDCFDLQRSFGKFLLTPKIQQIQNRGIDVSSLIRNECNGQDRPRLTNFVGVGRETCGIYSEDPLRRIIFGCPDNLLYDFDDYKASVDISGSATNVALPFKIEVSDGTGYPNSSDDCQCVKDYDGDDSATTPYLQDKYTSMMYVSTDAIDPYTETCDVSCFANDSHSHTDETWIQTDVFPRGIEITIPDVIPTGYLNCLNYTTIFPSEMHRCTGLPAKVWLETTGCPDMWRAMQLWQSSYASLPFYFNHYSTNGYVGTPVWMGLFDVISCMYHLPECDPPSSCLLSNVFLDVGFVNNTVETPDGPDAVGAKKVCGFTQARIELNMLISGQYRTKWLYSANIGPEIELTTIPSGDRDNFAMAVNPFGLIHDFNFKDFMLYDPGRFPYHPSNPSYLGCSGYSLNEAYWRAGKVRKMIGGPGEEYWNHCPATYLEGGQWCMRGTNHLYDFKVRPGRNVGHCKSCDAPLAGFDKFIFFTP